MHSQKRLKWLRFSYGVLMPSVIPASEIPTSSRKNRYLHEQDQSGAGARRRFGVCLDKEPRRDAAKLTQPCPMPAEDGAQQPRHGEHVLPMRHGFEDVLFDSLAVQEHPLLVTARAEVARLAGVGEQVVVPAGVAVDARKPVLRVAAFDEALDDLCLERAAQPPRIAEFRPMAPRALPQRARARIAWAGRHRQPLAPVRDWRSSPRPCKETACRAAPALLSVHRA